MRRRTTIPRVALVVFIGVTLVTQTNVGAQETVTRPAPSLPAWKNITEKDKAAYSRDGGHYELGPDSKVQIGVPQGKIVAHRLTGSRVYAGTVHDYWVYIPAQYAAGEATCLMVYLDGRTFLSEAINASVVMDNLIYGQQIPVMIGLFIDPGDKGPGLPIWGGADNRSIEYDSITDAYARFLIDEVLPTITGTYTISADPQCRGIAGASSGGAGAFTVAWHRPQAFRKVISLVGSFVDIRGGNQYPSIIRKSERKPLRVFLQDGANDLDIVFGNWPIANQDMAAALAYKEYDYRFEFGEGGHLSAHGPAVLPEAMKWLWRKP